MRAISFRCVAVRISSNNTPQAHLLDSPARVLRCVASIHRYCIMSGGADCRYRTYNWMNKDVALV